MVLELIVNVKRIPVLELFANYLINHYKFFFPFHTPIYFQILTLFFLPSNLFQNYQLYFYIKAKKKKKKKKKKNSILNNHSKTKLKISNLFDP